MDEADRGSVVSGDVDRVDAERDRIEAVEVDAVDLELTESAYFRGVHPLGWVTGLIVLVAIVFHTVIDTKYLIGNFGIGYWIACAVAIALSVKPVALHHIRVGIEKIASVSKVIAWVLAWAVFAFQLFNVLTRYGNDLVERDILFGQVVSLATMSFGLMFLLGINYGVRDGVNPRIDFWWADFKPKTKAWLDFVLHVSLFMPFIWMALRIVQPYAATALGRRFDGTWPSGARVWETWEQSPSAGELAVGPIKAAMLVAFVLLALQIVAEVIKTGFVMMGNSEYGELRATDVPQRIE